LAHAGTNVASPDGGIIPGKMNIYSVSGFSLMCGNAILRLCLTPLKLFPKTLPN